MLDEAALRLSVYYTLSIPLQWRIQGRLQSLPPPERSTAAIPKDVGGVPDPGVASSAVACWWVNQGSSFEQERRLGVLAAPMHGIDGRTLHPYEAMRELRAGDRVLHYVRKELLASSRVAAHTEIGVVRPDLHAGRHDRVYVGHVAYSPLGRAIHIDEIPVAWRIADGGPFDRNGNPKFGYLTQRDGRRSRPQDQTAQVRWLAASIPCSKPVA